MLPVYTVLWIAIILRGVAALVTVIFMLPLQIREARVNNGLKKLRYELLAYGTIIFVLNLFRIYALFTYFIENDAAFDMIQAILLIIGSIGYIALAVLGFIMYKQNYSPENKEVHRQIDELAGKK